MFTGRKQITSIGLHWEINFMFFFFVDVVETESYVRCVSPPA